MGRKSFKDIANKGVDAVGVLIIDRADGPHRMPILRPDWSNAASDHEAGIDLDGDALGSGKQTEESMAEAKGGDLPFGIVGDFRGRIVWELDEGGVPE